MLQIHDIFVCGAEFGTKESYTWQDVSTLPLILLEKNSSSRRFIDKKFKEKHIELSPQIEIAAHDLLIRFAAIHLGVSCVVEEFSKEKLENGEIKKLNVLPALPARSVGCAYVKGNPLSKAAKAFLELIKE